MASPGSGGAPARADRPGAVSPTLSISYCSTLTNTWCHDESHNEGQTKIHVDDETFERTTVAVVVAGNGSTNCSDGVMEKGRMYGASRRGANASEFFAIDWDNSIMAGSPIVGFDLRVRKIGGMIEKVTTTSFRICEKRDSDNECERDGFCSRQVARFCKIQVMG